MKSITTKYGRTIEVGQSVFLNKSFGSDSVSEEKIIEISDNGLFVKITNSNFQFSTSTGNAKGVKYSWYIEFN